MGGIAYLEVLDARCRVRQRVRVNSFPAVIGRSYSNEVILDDRYVCPQHAQVVQKDDGSFFVEDLGSVNGLFLPKGKRRLKWLRLDAGDVFRVGRTLVRFCTPDQEVPEAMTDGGVGVVTMAHQPAMAIPATLIGVFILGNGIYLSSFDEFAGVELLAGFIGIAILWGVWAGLWSFGTRLVSSRFRFLQHAVWVCTLSALLYLADAAIGYVSFALSTSAIEWIVGMPVFVGLLWLFLYGHLSLASSLAKKTRHIATGVILGCFAVLGGLAGYAASTTFSNQLVFDGTLKPISARLVRAQPTDQFFADLGELKVGADQEVDSDR